MSVRPESMSKKFIAVATIALFILAGAGCAARQPPPAVNTAAPPAPSPVVVPPTPRTTAAFGSEVALRTGESVTFDDGLAVLLQEINDSRCPKGVQCIWQGELAPVLQLSGGALDEPVELQFGTVRGLNRSAGGYDLVLSGVTEGSVALVVNSPAGAAAHADIIRLASPQAGQLVASPLEVTGEARGTWYFEASFPVKLLDANGTELAAVPAQAQSDWMTKNFVPFKAKLAFQTPATSTGTLVLKKDNPSGLPENDDELRVPVKFSASLGSTRRLKIFFYDQNKDLDQAGNVQCSRQGLVAVERDVPVSKTPIQDLVRLVLQGPTAEEKAAGIAGGFPLPGVELKGADLKDGVLTLEFADPNNLTGGGSCRVGILWFQIEATALQFPEVKSVRFLPEELFQP